MILAALIREAVNMREAMDKGGAALREMRRGLGDEAEGRFDFRLPYVMPGFRLLRLGRKARLLRRGGRIHFSAQKRSLFFARRLGLSLFWN